MPAYRCQATHLAQRIDLVHLWRWNLHAAVTTLAISPIMFGWFAGWPIVLQADIPIQWGVRAQLAADAPLEATRGPLPELAPPSAAQVPLVERITAYRVQPGDTLQAVADRFGISVETLVWANGIVNPDLLEEGQELTVLPVAGVLHTVQEGDTVAALAEQYGTSPVRLIEANGLAEPYALVVGQRLLVPGGQPLAQAGAQRVIEWPAPGTGHLNRRQFIEAAAQAAQETQRRLRVPASVTIAQAIHESYWGTSKLARNANNYFGIKARNGEGTAGVYWMDAWEVINGQNVIMPEPFRAYHSPEESFVDHGLFFLRNSRYHGAFRYVDDPRAFATAIARAGYATDPDYAAKLIRLMDQYNLYQYDLR